MAFLTYLNDLVYLKVLEGWIERHPTEKKKNVNNNIKPVQSTEKSTEERLGR